MQFKRRWQSIVAGSALLVGSTITALVGPAAPAGAAGSMDNPYTGAKPYVNPDWSAKAAAEPGGSAVANQPTFVWLDRIAAINGANGAKGLRAHLDAAKAQGANLVQLVIYDLPGRDCAALASNGELGPTELGRYQTDYIDPIVSILSESTYSSLRIVNIIEPDSLPNLVTNADQQATATEQCRVMKQNGNYLKGVGYALDKLGALSNTYNYIDAGHYGWLGWDTNFGPFTQVAYQAATSSGATPDDVAGFITNTAGYSPLHEPYFSITDTVNGTSVRQAKWLDWNQYADEATFAKDLRSRAVTAGFRSGIGMLVDTARNGWGGSARPSGPAAKTTVDEYVNGSRVDRRIHVGNWCNQSGAGIGERPTAAPESGIDAYVWAKPPGESDGASQPIDNDEGKGFDQMCDPDYGGNPRNNNNPTGALPNSPLAGHWFSAQFRQLLANAYPPISGGGGGDTSAPTAPTGLRVTGTTSSSVSLSWTASTDNVGVTGYTVYRNGTQVGTSATTSFSDSGLSASTAYTYTVRARDAAGNTSSASSSVTGTTTSGGGGGNSGCTAAYHVDNDWGAGFTATVTVTNTGTSSTSGWTVNWTWAGNQQVSNGWNATVTQGSNKAVTAKNAGHNGTVAAGGNTSFGFQATYSGTNAAPTLSCTTS